MNEESKKYKIKNFTFSEFIREYGKTKFKDEAEFKKLKTEYKTGKENAKSKLDYKRGDLR